LLERFIGILIEHHSGRFPLWLAPVQAVVATIVSDATIMRARCAAAVARGIGRSRLRNEKINYNGCAEQCTSLSQGCAQPDSISVRQARGRGAAGLSRSGKRSPRLREPLG
jgi:hypothetical protein